MPNASQPNATQPTGARLTALGPFMRVAKLTLVTIGVIGSLVVFPAGVSALALGWLLVALILLLTGRKQVAGLCCAMLGVILIVKSPSVSVAFISLVVVTLTTAIGCWVWKSDQKCRLAMLLSLLAAVWFGIDRWLEATAGEALKLANGRPIVCIGDSLTEGVHGGFPADLQKLVPCPVINLGRNGYTTQMAIDDSLPQLRKLKPQLVVVELGGHDYNTGQSRAATKQKLQQVISQIESEGAAVLLVEIPRGIIQDPFYGLERELAREFDLELVPDTMVRRCFFSSPIAPPGIWMDPSNHLSDDGLHPNMRGQVVFAQSVAAAIERMQD